MARDVLEEANDDHLAHRDANRMRAEGDVQAGNTRYQTKQTMTEIIRASEQSDAWRKTAALCSECGACTLVCPTCHCFLLYDQPAAGGQAERVRVTDSCLYAGYARMAGVGGMKPSPQPALDNRFANRLMHKFVWLPETIDEVGCVGCGRWLCLYPLRFDPGR